MFSHPFLPRIARRCLRTRFRAVPRTASSPASVPLPDSYPELPEHIPPPPETAALSPPPAPTPAPVTQTSSPEPKREIPDLDPAPEKPKVDVENFAYRWEVEAPTPYELALADKTFEKYPATLKWCQAKFRNIEVGEVPEVAFIGRSNVGKSSLLNALMNHKGLAKTSSKPGKTKTMTAFEIHRGKLLLVDMPGYGHASRQEWGKEIMKYLQNRKQLRRVFILIDASHGPKPADLMILDQLGNLGVSYQIVLSKIDKLSVKKQYVENVFEKTRTLVQESPGVVGLGEVLGVAGDPAKKGVPKLGVSGLRAAVLRACGLLGVK